MADLHHFRVVSPVALRGAVIDHVTGTEAICHLVISPDAVSHPDGDLIEFDVAREAVNDVIEGLVALDIVECGAITISHLDLALSTLAEEVQERAPGDPDEVVIWDEVAVKLSQSVRVTATFLAYFFVAAVIAATGVLTDSPILIVGAMVVGPEFAPIASVAFGVARREVGLIRTGASSFAIGAAAGVAAGALTAIVVRVAGQVPEVYRLDERPLTEFIIKPDVFTLIVAAAAAVAGMLALTQDRAGTLVGVLISVTTLPAIAEIGVAITFGRWDEAGGALAQLGINLVCLVVVGALTLGALRRATPRLVARRAAHPTEPATRAERRPAWSIWPFES